MPDHVETGICEGAVLATNAFQVSLPGNICVLQHSDEVLSCTAMIDAWRIIVNNTKIAARFEPEVVGFTWMAIGWVVVLLGVRRHGQKRVINVRCVRVSLDIGPVMILHQNDENGLDGMLAGATLIPHHLHTFDVLNNKMIQKYG